jgi:hypothetical protein
VLAIAISGAAAVGANVGILDSAADSTTGKLAAASDLMPVTVPDVSTTVAQPARTTTTTTAAAQQFVVDQAGSVVVSGPAGALRLERAEPAPGWTWQLSQTRLDALTVVFTNGTRTLDFQASIAPSGAIAAAVTEVPPTTAPAPTSSWSGGGSEWTPVTPVTAPPSPTTATTRSTTVTTAKPTSTTRQRTTTTEKDDDD